MKFEPTDDASVVSHLRSLSDAAGVATLKQMHAQWGWGPNTQWNVRCSDGSDNSESYTLLALALERETSVWLDALVALVPPLQRPDRWKSVLSVCKSSHEYEIYSHENVGSFKDTPQDALTCAWHSPLSWAVRDIWAIKVAAGHVEIKDTWESQIVRASEAVGLNDRKAAMKQSGANWQPFWASLRAAADLSGVLWPGPPEDWVTNKTFGTWLKRGVHAWDHMALMLDTPAMLEISWSQGCGHPPTAWPVLPLASLTIHAGDEFSHLFAEAITHPSRPGKCLEWAMLNSDVLDQRPKGPPTPQWARGTWREAIQDGSTTATAVPGGREGYAFTLTVLRNLIRHDPMPPSRRPRIRS